jgi:hypothetical protein
LKTSNAFEKIDLHASRSTPEDEQTVETLSNYLVKAATNDLEKFRAFYK